jgi:prepilin-type N-terminal cleavage/methylation domain-containing protein
VRARGLSLVELLIALSLVGIVMLCSGVALVMVSRAWATARTFAEEQQNARLVVEWMTRRLRLAGLGVPGSAVQEAAVEAVAFDADLTSQPGPERHRFCLDRDDGVVREQIGDDVSTACNRGGPLNGPGAPVVHLTFTYFDRANRRLEPLPLGVSERAQVARVRFLLVFDRNRSGQYEPDRDLALTGEAVIRKSAEGE